MPGDDAIAGSRILKTKYTYSLILESEVKT